MGVLGILIAIDRAPARRPGDAECTALINGSVGSRGTVDPGRTVDLAVVRYDALSEMSGQLSFSVALLNALGDGVVLSSINGRTETRTYAKHRPLVGRRAQAALAGRGACRPGGAVLGQGPARGGAGLPAPRRSGPDAPWSMPAA